MTPSFSLQRSSVATAVTRRITPDATRTALALLLLAFSGALPAADCSVSALGVNFGGYDPRASQDLDGVGSVDVRCDVAAPFSVALSSGSGTYAPRAMHAGAAVLYYNLYTSATYTTVWGDGTGATAVVPGDGVSSSLPIYGRIPARQNARVGSYVDDIVVTLTF